MVAVLALIAHNDVAKRPYPAGYGVLACVVCLVRTYSTYLGLTAEPFSFLFRGGKNISNIPFVFTKYLLSLIYQNDTDMDSLMTYPHETVAPSIHTDFINGVKFDICEVIPACYDMLSSSKSRFFVCVEDNHICFHESAEKYFKATGECRWDFFCKTKAECIDLIKQFADAYDSIEKWLERAERTPALKRSSMEKVNSIRTKMMDIFRMYPL